MQHLQDISTVVYLKLPYEEVEQRLGDLNARGVTLQPGQTLKDLYEERTPLYEKYADIIVDCRKKCCGMWVAEIPEGCKKQPLKRLHNQNAIMKRKMIRNGKIQLWKIREQKLVKKQPDSAADSHYLGHGVASPRARAWTTCIRLHLTEFTLPDRCRRYSAVYSDEPENCRRQSCEIRLETECESGTVVWHFPDDRQYLANSSALNTPVSARQDLSRPCILFLCPCLAFF